MGKLTPNKELEENISDYFSELGVGQSFQTQKQEGSHERSDRLNHTAPSAEAAETKYHRLGSLNHRCFSLTTLEAGGQDQDASPSSSW